MSAVTVEGIIETVSIADRTTQWGVKKATSFKLNGEWYSGGFKTWSVNEGDEVSISYETNAKGYKDVKGLAIKTKGAGAPPAANTGGDAPARSGATGFNAKTFPVDPLAPERTFNRQHAVEYAVKTLGPADSGADLDLYADAVISVARKYEAYTTGDLEREAAEEINSIAPPQAA